MNTNSTTPRRCAVCGRGLGYATRTFVINFDGWRYEICGYTNGCADRLMARLSRQYTSSTSATNDTVRVFGVAEVRRWP